MEERTVEDQETVRRVLEGDRTAFNELVGRYQKLVASVAWRHGTQRQDIEDVVSEVFIKAYTNLHQYRPEHPFATWLYRLAANHVVDRARRARKERGRVEMPEQVVDETPSAGEDLEQRERAGIVRAALAGLAEHYRAVIVLVYVEGLKVEEVARTLGLPSGTVKTRLMRGRLALRKALEKRHPRQFGAT